MRSLVFDLLLFTVVARVAIPHPPPRSTFVIFLRLRSLVLDLLLLTVVDACTSETPSPIIDGVISVVNAKHAAVRTAWEPRDIASSQCGPAANRRPSKDDARARLNGM